MKLITAKYYCQIINVSAKEVCNYVHGKITGCTLFLMFVSSVLLTFIPVRIASYYGLDDAIYAMVMIEFSFSVFFYAVFLFRLSEFHLILSGFRQYAILILLIIILQCAYVFYMSTTGMASVKLNYDYKSIISIALFIPIYEEIFYRGCLFGSICSVYKKGVIVPGLISSLVFSLMHTQFSSGLAYFLIFVVGAILTYARVTTRGLLLPVALHSSMNVFVIFINIQTVI